MSTPAAALNEPLTQISRELDECSLGVERVIAQAADALWTHPPRGGWSVGQCVAHLIRTANEWAPRLDRTLADAPSGSPPYKPKLTGRLLKWFIEPPYRMKTKAAPIFTPRQRTIPAADLLGEFLVAQQEVQRMLRLSDGKAIDRVMLPSPVNARMKYDIYSTFCIIAAHERRHLWQAERVLKALGRS